MRHFISTQDFSDTEMQEILKLAAEMKAHWHAPLLKGKIMGMIFFNPSFRTRTSFKIAMFELGGYAFDLVADRDIWKIEAREGAVMDGDTQEHVKELVGVLSRYCDVLGVRSFGAGKSWEEDKTDPILTGYMKRATVPVINMESTLYHPCQATADWLTLKENLGDTTGKKVVLAWTNHPRSLPTAVPNSFALIASRLGAEFVIACPDGYDLDPMINKQIQENTERCGGSFRYARDLKEAAAGAHVIYGKSWCSLANYGKPEQELKLKQAHKTWIIDESVMSATQNGCFMHCLPVRRNVEVSDAVIDSARSRVIDQAENRIHAQKAILSKLYELNGF